MLITTSNEFQLHTMCANKAGLFIPPFAATCAKSRAGASTPRWQVTRAN